MSDSNWRGPAAFVAFGFLLLIVSGFLLWDSAVFLTKQQLRYHEAAQRHAQEADERIQQECSPDLAFIALLGCLRQEIETAEDSKRSERDLDAQEVMARFTRLVGYTGLLGILLGLGSVWLIWGTLRETQRMAKDTREIGEAQVRAYVRIVGGSVRLEYGQPGMTDPSIRPIITISVKNYGQSPAQWFRWSASVRYYPPMHGKFQGSLDFAPTSWGKDIGPGDERRFECNVGSAPLADENVLSFMSTEFHLDIAISYVFTDVFGREISDERVFTACFHSGQLGVSVQLIPHVFDREMIEELARLNSPEMLKRFAQADNANRQ